VFASTEYMAMVIRIFAVPAEHALYRVVEHHDRCELVITTEDGTTQRHSFEPDVGRALIESLRNEALICLTVQAELCGSFGV
jgi:hypothetical protein